MYLHIVENIWLFNKNKNPFSTFVSLKSILVAAANRRERPFHNNAVRTPTAQLDTMVVKWLSSMFIIKTGKNLKDKTLN